MEHRGVTGAGVPTSNAIRPERREVGRRRESQREPLREEDDQVQGDPTARDSHRRLADLGFTSSGDGELVGLGITADGPRPSKHLDGMQPLLNERGPFRGDGIGCRTHPEGVTTSGIEVHLDRNAHVVQSHTVGQ